MVKSDLPPSYDESVQPELQEHHGASTPTLMKPHVLPVSCTPRTTTINIGDPVVYTRRGTCKRDCLIVPLLVPALFLTLLMILYMSVDPVQLFLDEHQFVIWVPVGIYLALYILVVFLL